MFNFGEQILILIKICVYHTFKFTLQIFKKNIGYIIKRNNDFLFIYLETRISDLFGFACIPTVRYLRVSQGNKQQLPKTIYFSYKQAYILNTAQTLQSTQVISQHVGTEISSRFLNAKQRSKPLCSKLFLPELFRIFIRTHMNMMRMN